jgi:hypothetical protein
MADGLARIHEGDNEKVFLVGGTVRGSICNPPAPVVSVRVFLGTVKRQVSTKRKSQRIFYGRLFIQSMAGIVETLRQ